MNGRGWFGDTLIRKANKKMIVSQITVASSQEEAPANEGTMIIDATCAPEDMRYPTDLGLLNDVRIFTEALVTYLWSSAGLLRGDGEVRPIEFGAKLSVSVADGFVFLDNLDWNAFHEGSDLPKQAMLYQERTGCFGIAKRRFSLGRVMSQMKF